MSLLLLSLFSCTTNIYPTEINYFYDVPEATTASAEDIGGSDETCVECEWTTPSELDVDVFGTDGNQYTFNVSDEQVAAMNDAWESGWYEGWYYYQIGSDDTWADSMIVTTAGGMSADFGKVQLSLIGQSTGMLWDESSIPGFSVDAGEFTDGQTMGVDRRFAAHNGMVSSIYREAIALEVMSSLGIPVPRTSFAWLSSNVWGSGVKIPYTIVEKYRQDWCANNADLIGGGCANVWEGVGDFTSPWGDESYAIASQCEFETCDNTRINELEKILSETPNGTGFAAATEGYLDWPSIQRHMCADWILWVGDDPYHNWNNVVWSEGSVDGKFRPLPYSTDISAGQDWYQDVQLYGYNQVASGCQYDSECWSETIATCEVMIDDFQALDPAAVVDSVHQRLTAEGMLRDGDEATYNELVSWYTDRAAEGVLEEELELYRTPWALDPCGRDSGIIPMGGGIVYDTAPCGGTGM